MMFIALQSEESPHRFGAEVVEGASRTVLQDLLKNAEYSGCRKEPPIAQYKKVSAGQGTSVRVGTYEFIQR
jgi:hypothetical protein